MDKILKDLSSLHWWIGIVAVGLAINLASAYLKPSTDRVFGLLSKWWATRSTKWRLEREKRMERLRGSKEEQTFIMIEALHLRVRAVMMLLLAFIIALGSIALPEPLIHLAADVRMVFLGISVLSTMIGTRDWFGVIRRQSEVYESRDAA